MLKEETPEVAQLERRNLNGAEQSDISLEASRLVEAIQTVMTEQGFNATQLARAIGFSKSKVSEILNSKRPLSKKMARALYELGVPAEVLFNALIAED